MRIWAAIGLCMVVFLALIFPLGTQAATIVVDTTVDDPTKTACTGAADDCSLRGAIIAANANPGPDTITLYAGTYTLDEVGTGEGDAQDGDLDIRGVLTINGGGQATTIIDGNGSETLENVFTIDGSTSAEMSNLTIQKGSGSPVGGILALGGLTLTNVTVDDNHGTGSGGGIYSSTSLIMTGSTVSDNTAANGAGIYVFGGTVTITSSTLSGNIATGPGGAITQNLGTITIESTTVSDNTASSGAGIFVFGGTVTITSSTLSGNIATGLGGAISQNLGTITIESTSQITLNQASNGGGISTNGGTLTVNDSSIHQNQVTSSGGGIYIGPSGDVTLNNTTVSRNDSVGSGSSGGGIQSYGALEMHGGQISLNSTASDGGGMFVYGASAIVDIYDAIINDNHTTDDDSYGGGIANNLDGQLTLTRTTVSNNYMDGTASSSTEGGGIFSTGSTLTLTDSLILDNDAIAYGGGVNFSFGTLTITNSIFRGNQVSGNNSRGGGLYNGSSSTTTIKQAEFSANVAAEDGGGIHNQGTLLTLENVTLSGNSAGFGAGIFTTGILEMTSILNSTIYGNTVPSGSGVGGLVAYNDVTVQNTIVAGNDNNECLDSTGITSNGYNISGDATCGFGAGDQVNTDPLLGALADNGGFSKTHALLPGSPAIDAGGTCMSGGLPLLTDQRGWTRPIDGDLNGTATCDIGAYEKTIDLFLPLIMR